MILLSSILLLTESRVETYNAEIKIITKVVQITASIIKICVKELPCLPNKFDFLLNLEGFLLMMNLLSLTI